MGTDLTFLKKVESVPFFLHFITAITEVTENSIKIKGGFYYEEEIRIITDNCI